MQTEQKLECARCGRKLRKQYWENLSHIQIPGKFIAKGSDIGPACKRKLEKEGITEGGFKKR